MDVMQTQVICTFIVGNLSLCILNKIRWLWNGLGKYEDHSRIIPIKNFLKSPDIMACRLTSDIWTGHIHIGSRILREVNIDS